MIGRGEHRRGVGGSLRPSEKLCRQEDGSLLDERRPALGAVLLVPVLLAAVPQYHTCRYHIAMSPLG